VALETTQKRTKKNTTQKKNKKKYNPKKKTKKNTETSLHGDEGGLAVKRREIFSQRFLNPVPAFEKESIGS
jgi:hypothetical protein